MHIRSRSFQRAAFTLIEILIAVALMGMIITAIYSSWTAVLRSADTGNRVAAIAQQERISKRVIEEALSSVLLYQENLKYYAFIADTEGDNSYLSFVAHLPPSFPGSGLFDGQPVRRVTFSVEPGKDNKKNLVLRQTALLMPDNSTMEPYKIVLSDNVSLFATEYMSITNNSALGVLNEWQAEWTQTNQLPNLVRVALAFGDRAEVKDLQTTVVALPATAVTREIQMPNPAPIPGRPGQMPNPIPQNPTAAQNPGNPFNPSGPFVNSLPGNFDIRQFLGQFGGAGGDAAFRSGQGFVNPVFNRRGGGGRRSTNQINQPRR